MVQIDISTIRTCDDANLALADVLETMENFDEAVKAAFMFAEKVSHIKCKGGDGHRVVYSVLLVIQQLLQAEGSVTPAGFAIKLRTVVHRRQRMIQDARDSLADFMAMINEGPGRPS